MNLTPRLLAVVALLFVALPMSTNADDAAVTADALLTQAQSTLVAAPETGRDLARRAAEIEEASAEPRTEVLLRAAWLEGEALFRLRQLEQADKVVEKYLAIAGDERSELVGKLLITRARIARATGNNSIALDSFQRAHVLFSDLGIPRYEAISLQGLSTLYMNAKRFDRSIEYDERAAAIQPDSPSLQVVSLNNRANALRKLGRYDEARELFQTALALDYAATNPTFAVRLQTNLSSLELAAENWAEVRSNIIRAQTIAEQLTPDQRPHMLAAIRARVALRDGDRRRAEETLDRAFQNIDLTTTPEDDLEAHALAVEIYEALGEPEKALAHLKAFKRLEDIERDIAASANQAILNAEFELTDKERDIERLRAEQLAQDVQLIRVRRSRERLLLSVAGLFALATIGFLVYQARQSKQVRKLTENMNRQLERVNKKLRESNTKLEKANSAKTEFLATTSHEIRTPLNAVMNLTGAVLEQTTTGTEQHVKLATALRSAEHLHEIVSDVLDVARFEGKRVVASPSRLQPREVIEDVVNLWRSKAEGKGLSFHVVIDIVDQHFVTDEKLLRQVLSNLLSNAIKFTAAGNVELEVTQTASEAPLNICVTDSGIGIAQEDQRIIFDSFRQVETGGTRSFQGTGLGLAICRQITNLLQGSISVESTVGQGSRFTVIFPQAQLQPLQAESLSPSLTSQDVDAALRDLDILAAEDNAVNAMVIQTILKGKVRSLTIVENGREAVEAVNKSDYDIVLMDKQMPVMDGVEATRGIRDLKGTKATIPIVAVTADAFAAAREELLSAGANDYLSKPIKPDDLKRAIALNIRPHEEPAGASA